MELEFGRLKRYPKIKIGRPEPEDLEQLSSSLGVLVPLGLKVSEREVREKFGLSEPEKGDILLGVNAAQPAPVQSAGVGPDQNPAQPAVKYPLNTQVEAQRIVAAQSEEGLSGAKFDGSPENDQIERLAREAQPHFGAMIEQLEIMMSAAQSMEELREMFFTAYPKLDMTDFGNAVADAMLAADLGGRVMIVEENG
jgi:phage gp29-like protein